MKSFIVTFIIAACSVTFVFSSTPVTQCANGLGPLPISVNMNNCTKLPCTIADGGAVDTSVEFIAVSNANSLSCTMAYSGKGLKAGSVIANDICTALSNEECPLKKGDTVSATYHNNIVKAPSGVSDVTYHVTLNDENNVVQFCFEATWHFTN